MDEEKKAAIEEMKKWLKTDDGIKMVREAGEEAEKLAEEFRKDREIDLDLLNRHVTI